jgi:hypothetical protein
MDLKSLVRQYIGIKEQADAISKRQNALKAELSTVVDEASPDEKGHKSLVIEDDTVGTVTMTRQRRVSKTLDMSVAETILERKGIKDNCIKMVPTLDEAAIMSAFYEGYLTEEDIDAMFPAKVSYAFLMDYDK